MVRREFWTLELPLGDPTWVPVPQGKALVVTRACVEVAVEDPPNWEALSEWLVLSCAPPQHAFVPLATLAHPAAALRAGGGTIQTGLGDNVHGAISVRSYLAPSAPSSGLDLVLHTGMFFQAKRMGPHSRVGGQCMLRSVHLTGYLEDNS